MKLYICQTLFYIATGEKRIELYRKLLAAHNPGSEQQAFGELFQPALALGVPGTFGSIIAAAFFAVPYA
jgi:hypothetical protein